MNSDVLARKVMLGFSTITLISISCMPMENIKPEPQISISPHAISLENECLTGIISEVDPRLFSIIIYVFVENGWRSLMNNGSPLILVSEDNSWVCEIINVEKGEIKQVAIFLIPNSYSPPVLYGDATIPIKVNLVAVARKFVIIEK